MIATLYLLLAAWGAASTWIASTAGRRPPRLGALYWLIAWPLTELPLQNLVASALVTIVAATLGAFESW